MVLLGPSCPHKGQESGHIAEVTGEVLDPAVPEAALWTSPLHEPGKGAAEQLPSGLPSVISTCSGDPSVGAWWRKATCCCTVTYPPKPPGGARVPALIWHCAKGLACHRHWSTCAVTCFLGQAHP